MDSKLIHIYISYYLPVVSSFLFKTGDHSHSNSKKQEQQQQKKLISSVQVKHTLLLITRIQNTLQALKNGVEKKKKTV